jgi:hypothetical protein
MEFHHPIRLLLGVMLAFAFPKIGLAQLTLNVNALASVRVSNTLPYNITVASQGQPFSSVQVSSTYSPSLDFVSAAPQDGNVSFTRVDNSVTFLIAQLIPGSTQALTLTLRPRLVTTVTNAFAATIGQFVVRTNVSTTVTEMPGTADVMVTITPPPQPIIVNDWVTFGVHLVNRGGGTVSGITLTNTFTNGPVLIRGYRPSTGGSVAQNPRRVIFNVGDLVAGQTTNYQITIQPTAATNIVLRSNFRFSGNADTNAANNTASATINVQPTGTNQLIASIASTPQQFNPQNALMEQRIIVTNVGPTEALSARVMFSNITYRVVNAVGTNNGLPFVVHPATIQPTQSVEMLIEYFIPSREPRQDPDLIAYSIGDVTPTASVNGSGVVITNIVWRQPFGAMTESNLVLTFPSTNRAAYEVQYSSSPEFTNALRALPTIIAQANHVMWVDYGPPKTVGRPRLGPTIINTNVVTTNSIVSTNDVVVTNIVFVTNDVTITTNIFIGTNSVISTNDIVGTNQISITNLNMRFYRAIQLP